MPKLQSGVSYRGSEVPDARGPNDASSLLIDLGRVVKAQRFCATDGAAFAETLDRGYRALRSDLERHGSLELEIEGGRFRLAGVASAIGRGHLDELARDFAERAVHRVRFDVDLDNAAFRAFVELLAADPEKLQQEGGAAQVLRQRIRTGITLCEPQAAEAASGEMPSSASAAVAGDPLADVARELASESGPDDQELEEAFDAAKAEPPSEERLRGLVLRARDPDTETAARAIELLIELDAKLLLPLLREMQGEADSEGRGALRELLVGLGERAATELARAIERGDEQRVREAAQLAGELRTPKAVAALRGLLESPEEARRKAAAKALGQIGSPAAVEALLGALESAAAGMPLLATFWLGATHSPAAVDGLIRVIRWATRAGRPKLAQEAIRSLGRLERPEAVPELVEILKRRHLFGRRKLRPLQLAAAAALSRIPGNDASGALLDASRGGDAQVRRAASQGLKRRLPARAASARPPEAAA